MKDIKEKFKTWWLKNPSLDSAEIPLPTPWELRAVAEECEDGTLPPHGGRNRSVLVARVAGKYFGDFLRESPSESAALMSAWSM